MAHVPSSAVCPGCHQPLPAALAQWPPELQCLSCGAIFPNPLVRPTTDSHGTYGRQFAAAPVSTYLFGPQLDAYRAHAAPESYEQRRTAYRRWLLGLGALFAAAIVLPFLCAVFRFGILIALVGAGYCLVFTGAWAVAYGMGLMWYGGALFEEPWLMNSKRAREKRAMWGDAKARNVYLLMGRVMMIVTGCIAAGNILFTSADLLLGSAGDSPSDRPSQAKSQVPSGPDPYVVEQMNAFEGRVQARRKTLEETAQTTRAALAELAQAQAEVDRLPNDLERRKTLARLDETIDMKIATYENHVAQWRKSVERLNAEAHVHRWQSATLDQNRTLPASLTLSMPRPRQRVERFPFAQVETAESTLRDATPRFADWRSGGDLDKADVDPGIVRSIEFARQSLEEVASRNGYRSPLLDQLPPPDLLAQAARVRQRRESEAASPNFPTFSNVPGPRRPPASVAKPTPPGSSPSNVANAAKPPRAADLPPFGKRSGFDLFFRFEPKSHVVRGDVTLFPSDKPVEMQMAGAADGALDAFPVPVAPQYFVETRVTRRAGKGPLFLVLPVRDFSRQRPVVLVVDDGRKGEPLTGLEELNRTRLDAITGPGAPTKGERLPLDKTVRIDCDVGAAKVTLRIDDEVVYHWEGEASQLDVPHAYGTINPLRLRIGCQDATFQVEQPRLGSP